MSAENERVPILKPRRGIGKNFEHVDYSSLELFNTLIYCYSYLHQISAMSPLSRLTRLTV